MSGLRRICVFAGSNPGRRPAYRRLAGELGAALAGRGIDLVYGGASVGLMGELADAALAGGGRVTGVIPRALVEKEIAHDGLSEQRVVGSMHERKALMAELSDAFIALPGGIGTLEELFEVLTWWQLGLHAKPCGLLDPTGYYRPLLAFIDHAALEGFIGKEHSGLLSVAAEPDELLAALERRCGASAEVQRQWITPEEI